MRSSLTLVITLTSIMVLTGCGTTTASRTGTGAAVGAATGAAVGSLSGNAGKGALIGAGAGALGGYLYDQAEKQRAQETAAPYGYDRYGRPLPPPRQPQYGYGY